MKGCGPTGAAREVFVDAGGVLAVWTLLLLVENVAVAGLHRDLFSGAWELEHARRFLLPVGLACLVPIAFVAVGLGRLWGGRRARVLAALGGACGGLVAFGVSTGRHLANASVRAAFVALIALLAGGMTWGFVRRAAHRPLGSVHVVSAITLAIVAWSADAFVLARLYPAFHDALFAVTLASWAVVWGAIRDTRVRLPIACVGGVLAALGLFLAPWGARKIAPEDNVRRVLLERAPLFGRAVLVASHLAPPPALDDEEVDDSDGQGGPTVNHGGPRTTRSLDWSGRDIVLLTVDALRADHVSAYGYGRPTTPNIDRLASRGTLFRHAYCPTPHTSYSISSLMTGKYMRPLLAMGLGGASETAADLLRHYGYRTAAFYPPAVFFIDTHKFTDLRDRSLGFEYAKVEFAGRDLRRQQVRAYLDAAPKDKPIFLWLHAFEPHEPYETHPGRTFTGAPATDAYDSEIAEADAVVGDVVQAIEEARPGAVIVFTADHGEEFGDHGGRYHGTSVYEEQVRVPLVVVGPGVKPGVVEAPVQTIDVLPTLLSALDVPMPARIRGRDLGPELAGREAPGSPGLAFAETDDDTLVALGSERLICTKKIGACTLFDVAHDPSEQRAVTDRPERTRALRKIGASIERQHGKVEAAGLPEALRRAFQGDRDAAEDLGPLFDDARVEVRRATAQCAFRLRAPELRLQLERALAHDEDSEVTAWSALALLRPEPSEDRATDPQGTEGRDGGAHASNVPKRPVSSSILTRASEVLSHGSPRLRVAAALAFAESGDGRGEDVLIARWNEAFGPGSAQPGELDEARDLASAFGTLRARAAVPALVASLSDVRLRPTVVATLGDIGEPRARDPLLEVFREERYVHLRPLEARVLLALGARKELFAPLARFAGTPEPMSEALGVARDAGLLVPATGGCTPKPDAPATTCTVHVPSRGRVRVLVASAHGSPAVPPVVRVAGAQPSLARVSEGEGAVWMADLDHDPGPRVAVELDPSGGVSALWLVRLAEEIPAPKPVAWRPEGPRTSTPEAVDGGL